MRLITENQVSDSKIKAQLAEYKKIFGRQVELSFLPQLWQELSGLPKSLKNGETLLLSEKIEKNNNLCKVHFSNLRLYLVSERFSTKLHKYIVDLKLQINGEKAILAQVYLTLLSEVSWNEQLSKN